VPGRFVSADPRCPPCRQSPSCRSGGVNDSPVRRTPRGCQTPSQEGYAAGGSDGEKPEPLPFPPAPLSLLAFPHAESNEFPVASRSLALESLAIFLG